MITFDNREKQAFEVGGQFLDIKGKRVGLSQYQDKTLFINLLATELLIHEGRAVTNKSSQKLK